jgi:hypothetical protein
VNPIAQRASQLAGSYLDGQAKPEEVRELEALLRDHEEARIAFLNEARLTDGLRLMMEPSAQAGRAGRGRAALRIFAPLAAAAALLVAVGLFLLPGKTAPALPAGTAYVKTTSPGVKFLRGGKILPVASDTCFQPGDRVDTGADGQLTVAYAGEATELAFLPKTVCQLGFLPLPSDPGSAAGVKHLYLDVGSLSGAVARQPQSDPMSFDTPHGVATLLGTRVRLNTGMGSTRLDVDEGQVRLQRAHDRDSVIVGPGHYAVISDGFDPVAIPAAVSWEEFSRLRKLRTDGPVIRKDDFEGGLSGWEPMVYSKDLSRPLRRGKEAVEIGLIANEERGRTRVLRLYTDRSQDAASGVELAIPADFEGLTLEGDLQVSPDADPRHLHLGGLTKPSGTKPRILYQAPAGMDTPIGKVSAWKHFRVEYTRDKAGPGADAVDVKGFLEGRLVSWLTMEGKWSGFAPQMYFFVAGGQLLLDNLVLRQRVLGRVQDGLLAAYHFNEGTGTSVHDCAAPDRESLDLSIGDPAQTRWVPGALWVTGKARIACPPKDKLMRAWNRTGALTFEFWMAIDEAGRTPGQKYVVFDLIGKWGSFNYNQNYEPANITSTAPRPRHFVVMFQREGDAATMTIYADGRPDRVQRFDELGRNLGQSPFQFQLPGGQTAQTVPKMHPWLGGYYHLAVYDRVLTAEEILRNRHCGVPEE